MGQIHNELRKGVLSAGLTRALGAMRGDSGLERFGETMQPVIDLWRLPEWSFLRTERLCAYARSVAANAAGFGGVAIANPALQGGAASQLIIVVEAITMITVATQELGIYGAADSTTDLTNSSFGFTRDQRPLDAVIRVSQGVVRYANTPVAVPANHDIVEFVRNPGAGVGYGEAKIAVPYVLMPGRMLTVYTSAVNIALTVNFKWRERRAPFELA